jgi:geranylgeranyl diphosphate synthase type II
MVGGQVIDLESEGKAIELSTLEALQAGKTAALLTAACVMGARLAGADSAREEAARLYGYNVGLSFQIVDDILDVTASAEELGKPVGSDADNEKVTYVSLLGLDEARRLAVERTKAALAALTVFGEEADSLRQLAEALLTRTH